MLIWSPFYSKINTFNQVVYMDWFFGLGFGNVTEKNNKTSDVKMCKGGPAIQGVFNREKPDETETASGFLWQTALKFYLSETWDVRLNLVTMNYKLQNPSLNEEVWNHHYDLSVSLGWSF